MNRLTPSAPECAFQLSRTIGPAFRTGPRGPLRREGAFHRRSSFPKPSKPLLQIAPAKYRGTMGALNQLAGCSGILVALLLSLPLRSSPGWWRTMFWIACVPAAMLAGGMAVAAESPRWLYKRGRYVVSLLRTKASVLLCRSEEEKVDVFASISGEEKGYALALPTMF
jgi:MFS family permease